MNEMDFENWLLQRFGEQRSVADAITRCRGIETAFGIDLEKVNLETIGYLLTYSKEDERTNRKQTHPSVFSQKWDARI